MRTFFDVDVEKRWNIKGTVAISSHSPVVVLCVKTIFHMSFSNNTVDDSNPPTPGLPTSPFCCCIPYVYFGTDWGQSYSTRHHNYTHIQYNAKHIEVDETGNGDAVTNHIEQSGDGSKRWQILLIKHPFIPLPSIAPRCSWPLPVPHRMHAKKREPKQEIYIIISIQFGFYWISHPTRRKKERMCNFFI